MNDKQIIKSLEQLLISSYCLLIKTQNYHWNVRGEAFFYLHNAFEAQYQDLFLAVDDIAERIRALGEIANLTTANLLNNNTISDADNNKDAFVMVKDLANDHHQMVEMLEKAIKQAQNSADEATADLFISRIQSHQKTSWMLLATQKN